MASNKLSALGGAVIGMALGVAAGLFLSSKKGKKFQKDTKEKVAEFYEYISPKLKKMKQLGEKEYYAFVEKAAKNFGRIKKISAEELKTLTADAKKAWKRLTEEQTS